MLVRFCGSFFNFLNFRTGIVREGDDSEKSIKRSMECGKYLKNKRNLYSSFVCLIVKFYFAHK